MGGAPLPYRLAALDGRRSLAIPLRHLQDCLLRHALRFLARLDKLAVDDVASGQVVDHNLGAPSVLRPISVRRYGGDGPGGRRVVVLFGPIEPATVNANGTKRAQKRRNFNEKSNDFLRSTTLTW